MAGFPLSREVEPAPAVDDAVLIQGALAGRREDFDTLVERYQKPLYAFAYRFVHDHTEAADIVQATFLQAYAHLRQFAQRASFKTWLHRIALNQCRALHRAARRRRELSLDEVNEARLSEARLGEASVAFMHPTATDPAADVAGWKPALERLIARLPLRQRTVVMLRIFSDLPFKEVARVEGISENSAKVNYHHAIVQLRKWLREAEV